MDLIQYIENHQIVAEVLTLPVQTPTVDAAASAVGTSPDHIVKSLLFLVAGEPVLAITCGNDRVDRRSIAAHFDVGRKRVKMADAATVLEITGYAIGAVPPFGLKKQVTTLIDERVLQREVVYAGGGGIDTLVRVSPQEIVRITEAVDLDLLSPSSSHETR